MSTTKIPERIIRQLLVRSAGRCQFRGCNKSLYQDLVTKRNFNQSYVAHIVADKPNGPRGDSKRSKLLAKNLSNLMLLCDTHHRLIDIEAVEAYPESLLLRMKTEHEERIERVSAISPEMQSHVVTYKANVGLHTPSLSYEAISEFLLPFHYPAQSSAIDLSLSNSPQRDKDDSFWKTELENLETQFTEQLRPKLRRGEIQHLSIFAFAPMPLLIRFGALISDIQHAEIHQPVRAPKTWNLTEEDIMTEYQVSKPDMPHPVVALNISLSATITNDRIIKVLGKECSVYTITITEPFNDFLKAKRQLQDFSMAIRKLLNEIKVSYGAQTPLHIFPAMPIATAIELGRVWMPKADMSLIIYDENTANSGFFRALVLKNE